MDFDFNCINNSFPPYTNFSRGRCLTHIDIEGSAAKTTIKKLKLDCERLKELRKNAIMKTGLHKIAPKPISSLAKVGRFI